MQITQAELKELLHYDPETGTFTWVKKVSSRRPAGSVAGCLDARGYVVIGIRGKRFYAHRLVFLYMEGIVPPKLVDHINRNTSDNRWLNLRHADSVVNNSNAITNNKFVGVSWRRDRDQWQVYAKAKQKMIHLGFFTTHLAACYARHAYDQFI